MKKQSSRHFRPEGSIKTAGDAVGRQGEGEVITFSRIANFSKIANLLTS